MNNSTTDSITIKRICISLKDLLATYQSEKGESQRDDDTRFMEYWECACQTIYDVAAALSIPLDEKSGN